MCDTFHIGNIHLAGQFWMFFRIVKYHVAECFFASLSFFGKWHVAGQFWRCANTLDHIFQKRKFHVATKIWMSPVLDMYWLPGKFEWGLYWESINCWRNLNWEGASCRTFLKKWILLPPGIERAANQFYRKILNIQNGPGDLDVIYAAVPWKFHIYCRTPPMEFPLLLPATSLQSESSRIALSILQYNTEPLGWIHLPASAAL